MVMGAVLVARVVKLAGRMRLALPEHAERAGHAEMHQKHIARGKISHQIFGATAKAGHDLALEPGGKALLKGKAPTLSPCLRLDDLRAFHRRLQATADGFDFG